MEHDEANIRNSVIISDILHFSEEDNTNDVLMRHKDHEHSMDNSKLEALKGKDNEGVQSVLILSKIYIIMIVTIPLVFY